MKKKLLPIAMLAGLAGAAGNAQARHVRPDGKGQVLVYPHFSTPTKHFYDKHQSRNKVNIRRG